MKSATSLNAVAERRTDLFHIGVDAIKVDPNYNVRKDMGDLEELSRSIEAVGVRVPLTVRMQDGAATLVAGHRRLAAVQLARKRGADIQTVPCVPEPRYTSEEDRIVDLISSNEGKPLSMLEQAEVFKRLQRYDWTIAKIAEKTGKSDTHIGHCLELAGAPPLVRAAVANGKISAGTAHRIVKTSKTPEAAVTRTHEVIARAAAEGKSRASAKHLTPKEDRKRPGPIPHPASSVPSAERRFAAVLKVANSAISAVPEVEIRASLQRDLREALA